LKYLAEDYQLTEIPSRDTEVLCLRLRVIRDATPDNPEDNEEQDAQIVETLTPTGTPTAARQDVYNFRRFVFDDVVMDDDVIALVVEFYYAGDADAEQPLTELYAYYELAETQRVKLTKKDRQVLEEYGEK
jgi:Cdc6-like AAA superfamily ATPase